MKTEDYDKLKQLCDANGFELLTESPKEKDKFFVVKKKDIWYGVEFFQVEAFNPIMKVKKIEDGSIWSDGMAFSLKVCKPSTESAYVEQLKKIAFDKFGEIKEGDRFQMSGSAIYTIPSNIGFYYFKDQDLLKFSGITIYHQGRWAEKLPERVKVEFDFGYFLTEKNDDGYYMLKYSFHINKNFSIFNKSCSEVGRFLSQQLEDYLNKQL